MLLFIQYRVLGRYAGALELTSPIYIHIMSSTAPYFIRNTGQPTLVGEFD